MRMGSLRPGKRAIVSVLQLDGLLYRRLLDLGFIEDAPVEAVMRGPAGDPVVYCVRGSQVALRKTDADMVHLKRAPRDKTRPKAGGAYHRAGRDGVTQKNRALAPPVREDNASESSDYLVTLAGNPNTGKSTVFNALTGLRQHVGNWPGKTVTRVEGICKYHDSRFTLVDLPGTYSLISNSIEEEIARDFIVFGQPDCTVVIVDATCLERNLNLVLQILQITDRVVVCVNLLDEARRKGIEVDLVALAGRLGVPVVGTEARNGKGLETLKEDIFKVASGAVAPRPMQLAYDETLEQAISDLTALVEKTLPHTPNPRWIALRLLDGGDKRLLEEFKAGLLAYRSGRVGSRSLPTGVAPE
jgi:Fe2+ transport system protein FeoA/GTP-binding protein EngB required for normal cell division